MPSHWKKKREKRKTEEDKKMKEERNKGKKEKALAQNLARAQQTATGGLKHIQKSPKAY